MSRNKIQKSKFSDNSGFTLVEMVVVMAMIAIIMTIGVTSMISARNQNSVRNASKLLQSAIREAANKSITVSPDKITLEPAKAWGIKIPKDTQTSYSLIDYTAETQTPNDEAVTTLDSNLIIYVDSPAVTGDVSLLFSSPFASFKAIDGDLNETKPWEIDEKTRAYIPQGTQVAPADGNIKITLEDQARGIKNSILVNYLTGEASVE